MTTNAITKPDRNLHKSCIIRSSTVKQQHLQSFRDAFKLSIGLQVTGTELRALSTITAVAFVKWEKRSHLKRKNKLGPAIRWVHDEWTLFRQLHWLKQTCICSIGCMWSRQRKKKILSEVVAVQTSHLSETQEPSETEDHVERYFRKEAGLGTNEENIPA